MFNDIISMENNEILNDRPITQIILLAIIDIF